MISTTNRSLPSNSGPGETFELFSAQYTYKGKKGETLAKHPRGGVCLRGFVPDKYFPVEGGLFKMYHHRVGGALKFGDVKLNPCVNVVVEEGLVYFEDESSKGKYVLVPCPLN